MQVFAKYDTFNFLGGTLQRPNDAIVYYLESAKTQLELFTADLKGDEWLARPAPKANCAAWLIGHLVMTERRALTVAGAVDLPSLPDGFEKRFARDEVAAAANEFGDPTILMPLWSEHRRRLIEVVKTLSPEVLNKPIDKPSPRFKTVGECCAYMALHSTMHAGQITIIRRHLGRPPLI